MPTTPHGDKPAFVCHTRRHMTASEWRTYNTMWIMLHSKKHEPDESVSFHGRMVKLANYNNTSIALETINIKSLEKKGWLALDRRQRYRGGKWGTNQYVVYSHDEYVQFRDKSPFSKGLSVCPPYRYDMTTGKPVNPGILKPGLAAANLEKQRSQIRKLIRADLPEEWLDIVAAARKHKTKHKKNGGTTTKAFVMVRPGEGPREG